MSTENAAASIGVLLVGHGTRDLKGVAAFLETAKQVQAVVPKYPLEPCFLELAEPNIATGVERLAQAGVEQIVVAPVLLFSAAHAQHDIPEAVAAVASLYPRLRFQQTPPLDCHPRLVELSAQRFLQTVKPLSHIPPTSSAAWADTLLILVARGSRDPLALANLQRFSAARQKLLPVATELCFISVTEPRFSSVLPRLPLLSYSRFVVQPHFLFPGQLVDEIRHQLPTTPPCLLTSELGPSPLLAKALAELIEESLGTTGTNQPEDYNSVR